MFELEGHLSIIKKKVYGTKNGICIIQFRYCANIISSLFLWLFVTWIIKFQTNWAENVFVMPLDCFHANCLGLASLVHNFYFLLTIIFTVYGAIDCHHWLHLFLHAIILLCEYVYMWLVGYLPVSVFAHNHIYFVEEQTHKVGRNHQHLKWTKMRQTEIDGCWDKLALGRLRQIHTTIRFLCILYIHSRPIKQV